MAPKSVPTWVWIVAVLVLIGIPVAYRPRGIRNNNPGNLRPMPRSKWLGEVAPDTSKGGPFSRFERPWQGWRAMLVDVYGDILIDGLNTIRKLVAEYAPGTDNNDESAYVKALVKAVGVDPDMRLNVYLHGPALLAGIAKHENGVDPDLVWGAGEREKGIEQGLAYVQSKGWA